VSADTIDFTEELPTDEACRRLVEQAVSMGASDLLIFSEANQVTAAVRHLGMMVRIAAYPYETGQRIIRHMKVEAGMDLGERRRPLDGRWLLPRGDGRRIDFRVNSLPTLYGEDVCLRILDSTAQSKGIDALGLSRGQMQRLRPVLESPSGLVLVTGPTGSGKTTTLYSFIQLLNNGRRKINTIEDPIEYEIEGVRQSQISHVIDLGFADILVGVLRQAPDVIMIGEIRDPDTAATAVRAANSGHLVFATLHAPIAAAAVQSMLALGAPPHFLATSLLAVVSQRLVRALCPACRVSIDVEGAPQIFGDVRGLLEPDEPITMFAPRGCDACLRRGYVSRAGVFEVMAMSPRLRTMVAAGATAREINQRAVEEGMIDLRQAALLHVARGVTSIEEIFRAVPTEYLGLDDLT
jgi:type II secretory ATPase GspE/PulE/Tfp pilus assembly ATPase PilB-like protein